MNGQVKIVDVKVAFKPKHWQNEYNHNKKHIVPHYGSISSKDIFFLREHSNVKKICEIGTGSGRSTKALSKWGAEVHTIDQYDHQAEYLYSLYLHRRVHVKIWNTLDHLFEA